MKIISDSKFRKDHSLTKTVEIILLEKEKKDDSNTGMSVRETLLDASSKIDLGAFASIKGDGCWKHTQSWQTC